MPIAENAIRLQWYQRRQVLLSESTTILLPYKWHQWGKWCASYEWCGRGVHIIIEAIYYFSTIKKKKNAIMSMIWNRGANTACRADLMENCYHFYCLLCFPIVKTQQMMVTQSICQAFLFCLFIRLNRCFLHLMMSGHLAALSPWWREKLWNISHF